MSYLTLPDGDLYYEHRDGDGPTLVLVHGLCCDSTDWREQVEHFASKGQATLTLDLRGHGQSTSFTSGIEIGNFARDVVALLEALDIGPVVLAGHSMGCRVVIEAASLAPHRVAGIALVDGSWFRPATDGDVRAAVAAQIAASGGWHAAAEDLFAQMFTADSVPAVRDAVIARALAVPEAVGTSAFTGTNEWDATRMSSAIQAITAPLLVVQTTQSVVVDGRRVREPMTPGETTPWLDLVRASVPAARIEILPGQGHFPQIEAPALVNEHLAALAAACA